MTRFFALLTCASALCLVGCAEGAKPGASPGVTVNETPDLNPQTDRDVDVTFEMGASDATLGLMASWYPRPLAPVLRTATLALLDEPLLHAFRYTPPSAATRAWVRRALRLRGRAVRLLPPRGAPHFARQNQEIRSYPDGYRLADLGTRPVPGLRGCPVRRPD